LSGKPRARDQQRGKNDVFIAELHRLSFYALRSFG
jgi:hypothetical protein